MRHYLDYNATAPIRPEVITLMAELQRLPFNASSVHAEGREAKKRIEDARRVIAGSIGAFPNEVVFTASGTEANNWALRAFSDRQVFVSAVEHSSVLKPSDCHSRESGNPSDYIITVTERGVVDLASLENRLAIIKMDPRVRGDDNKNKPLVSVMLANNETGVIQPVREITERVHAMGGIVHCDAVQAFGKIPVDFTALGVDLMTISAHKMGGSVGAAALVIKNGLTLSPLLQGGGQELNRRAGTENVAAIAGFAKAAELMDFRQMQTLRKWLDALETEVEKLGGSVIGKSAPRLPNTSCIAMPGITAEAQLVRLDLEGIAISAGSACSSGRIETSHVLAAMHIDPKIASCAIRTSGGWGTIKADVDACIAAMTKFHARKSGGMT